MRNLLVIQLFLFLISTLQVFGQRNQNRVDYIEKYKLVAIEKMHTHGIPASITLAQGCLESGDGLSELATKANNHFGIKCHTDWGGRTYYKKDDEPGKSCFRKYDRVEDSFKDHSDFLRYRDRYAFLFDLEVTDYKGWAHGLKRAGYATNPQYAQQLIKIIEDYELYKYDIGVDMPPSPSQLEAIKVVDPAKKSIWYKHSRNRTIYQKNGVAYVIANKGDTYGGIALEYNLFKKELLSYNDLVKDVPIAAGTVVYLERKKSKAAKHLDIHFGESGDTYYSISQRYGVRLKSILKYNGKGKKDIVREGDKVYLRKKK